MSGSRALSRALYFAAALPPLIALAVILCWHVDVPFWDQYDIPGRAIDRWASGDLELADLLVQNNEARKFVPHVIWVGLVAMTGSWHALPELFVTWSLALCIVWGIAAVLWRQAVRSPSERALCLLTLTTLLFSLASWEHWLWGISLEAYLAPFFLVFSLLALGRGARGVGAWAVAAVGCFGGSFSFSSGMVLWPLVGCGGLVLGLPALRSGGVQRRRVLVGVALFALAGVASIGGYFWDYHAPSHHQGFGAGLAHPVSVYLFFARWISGPLTLALALSNPTAEIVGTVVLLGGLGVVAWAVREAVRADAWRDGAFVLALCLGSYSFASGVAAALGRSEMGVHAWRAPRYICFSLYFYAGVLVLLSWLGHRLPPAATGRRRFTVLLQAVLVGMITVNSVSAIPYLEITRDRLLRARTAVQLWLTGLPSDELGLANPHFEERQGARVHRLVEAGVFPISGLDPALFTERADPAVAAGEAQSTLVSAGAVLVLEVQLAQSPRPGDAAILTSRRADGTLAFEAWDLLEATADAGPTVRVVLDPETAPTRLLDAQLWYLRARDGRVTPMGLPAPCADCTVPVR